MVTPFVLGYFSEVNSTKAMIILSSFRLRASYSTPYTTRRLPRRARCAEETSNSLISRSDDDDDDFREPVHILTFLLFINVIFPWHKIIWYNTFVSCIWLIHTCAYQWGKKRRFFGRSWRTLLSCYFHFEIRPFALLPMNPNLKFTFLNLFKSVIW